MLVTPRTSGGIAYDRHAAPVAGAPTLLFIHGVGCRRQQFAALIAELLPYANAVALDLPGHGESLIPDERVSIASFASAVASVLDHAGIAQATLVGHSLGAAVCVEVAARLRSRVPQVIALDALINPHVYPKQPAALVAISRAAGLLFHPIMTRLLVRALLPAPRDPALAAEIMTQMLRTPARISAHASASLAAWDRDAALTKASAAVLIIPARAFHRPVLAAALAPRCAIASPVEGGHFFFMTDPWTTAAAIRAGGLAFSPAAL